MNLIDLIQSMISQTRYMTTSGSISSTSHQHSFLIHHHLLVIISHLWTDQWSGDAEVEWEEEREDCHHLVQLQHQTTVILTQTCLLDTWDQRLLVMCCLSSQLTWSFFVNTLFLIIETDHTHSVGQVSLLVGGGESLVVHRQVPLHGESVVVVGDDDVQAGVEASPPPDVLTISVESSPASQTFSVKCLLVHVLGSPGNV